MKANINVQGWIDILDVETGDLILHKKNAIHWENFSQALAQSLCSGPLATGDSNNAGGFITGIALGNGGTNVGTNGVIIYKTPNYIGSNAGLFNQTYEKVVNQYFGNNIDPANNRLTINHISGKAYTDVIVACQLGYGEPSGQQAFDNTTDFNGNFVFDELGLVSSGGKLLTHVIFHPVQKSLNRMIEIKYTVRIQTLYG